MCVYLVYGFLHAFVHNILFRLRKYFVYISIFHDAADNIVSYERFEPFTKKYCTSGGSFENSPWPFKANFSM